MFKKEYAMLLFNSRLGPHHRKLRLCSIGPYKIIEVVGIGTFYLSIMEYEPLEKLVNGLIIKPYLGVELQNNDHVHDRHAI